MEILTVPTDSITPYKNNARVHSERQIRQIAASIQEFGFTNPILTHNGTIIAGHARYEAARLLELAEVPTIDRSDLTEAQWKAYVIADNRLAEEAEWDTDLLSLEIDGLEDVGIDLEALGIDDIFFEELSIREFDNTPATGLTDPDDVPEPPAKAITQPGDLWILGEHRLLCGDSTDADSVAYLMDGAKADLWLTDPPYNVALGMNETPEQAKARNRRVDGKTVSNDSMSDEKFREFLVSAYSVAFNVMKPGASFYVWHSDTEGLNFRGAIKDSGQQVRQCLIWKKPYLVMGRQDYHWQHEPCLYGWKDGAAHGWYTDRKQTTVLEFDRPSRSEEHPTMKPVALFEYQLGNSTAPQGLVLDTFLGSGTTLIAAERLGRKCYGIEIDPIYCDVIVARWEAFTGKKAVLHGGS